jgi:diguanylate cyclase (GGDEF)-like protein/PAS domain S-box-containing protein
LGEHTGLAVAYRKRALGRAAAASLVVIVICACAFGLWTSRSNYAGAKAVEQASRLTDAYQRAAVALSAESAIYHQSSLDLSPDASAAFDRAASQYVGSLAGILPQVAPDEQGAIRALLDDHAAFAAVARHHVDVTGVASAGAPDAAIARIKKSLGDLEAGHRNVTQDRLASLDDVASISAALTSIIVAGGLGCLIFFLSVVRSYEKALDLAVRRELEQLTTLAAAEQRFRALLANTSDVILVIDDGGIVRYLSPMAERYTPGLTIGESALKVILPDDHQAAQDLVAEASQRPDARVIRELRVLRPDGTFRNFDVICVNQQADPSIRGFVLTCHDMTERKVIEDRLKVLAFLDPLTKLSNRAYFLEQLERAVAQSEPDDRSVALVFLDLDNFKLVNDTLGHQVGDKLLMTVAERIQGCIRSDDVAARLGGDEFTILFKDVPDAVRATRLASRVANALRQPIDLGGHEVTVTASIGIAVSVAGADTPGDLLRNADLAMYHAKTRGSGESSVFDPSMLAAALEGVKSAAA